MMDEYEGITSQEGFSHGGKHFNEPSSNILEAIKIDEKNLA
jgi:hypothetical protein